MNILYFGRMCDFELYDKTKKNPYDVAQLSYEQSFIEEACKKNNIEILSIYQIRNFPKEKIFFRRKKANIQNAKIKYIPFINIPFFKEICFFIYTCFAILFWNIKNRNEKERIIYANIHYPPVSLGIVLMGKILKLKKIITFTDLPLFTYSRERIKKMPVYKRCVIRPYLNLVNFLQHSYDFYVLFSEPMKEIVNKNNKPYIIMEGIYNKNNIILEKEKKYNAIAYAGTLNKELGIQKILDVFESLKDESIELWIIGKGDMEETIKKTAEKDKRIKFLGFLPKSEVFKYLKEAKLLINLRNPEDKYTKYSFPSKTFEYMVSGTPFFTTKLEGIPSEYYNYLYCIDSYETNRIAEKIKKILEKDESELEEFGLQARKFILKNKNAEKQVKKIFDFLQDKI